MNNIFFVFFLIIFNVSSLLKDRLSPEELRELTDVVAAELEKKTRTEVEKSNQELRLRVNGLEREVEKLKESPKLIPQPAPRRKRLRLQDVLVKHPYLDLYYIIDPSIEVKVRDVLKRIDHAANRDDKDALKKALNEKKIWKEDLQELVHDLKDNTSLFQITIEQARERDQINQWAALHEQIQDLEFIINVLL